MGVPTDEYITVKLSLHGSECLKVTPGENLMAVDDADLEVSDLDNFRLWKSRCFIKVAFHDVSLTLCCCEVFKPFDGL